MLRTILSVSGKPGLFKLISQTKSLLIAESLVSARKRTLIYPTEKVVSLGDIAIYTDSGEIALGHVLETIKKKYNSEKVNLDVKKNPPLDFTQFMVEVLPDYDKERVLLSDIKKIVQWYNLLIESGEVDFTEEVKEDNN